MHAFYRLAYTLIAVGMLATVSLSSSPSSSESSNPFTDRSNFVGELIEETGFYQSLRLDKEKPILRKKSKFQTIEVRKSPYYGRILILDGVVQLTERDADSYNEMMAHVPMFQHKNPKRVLIIGGGDGYVLSEVLKHKSVEHVDHVDLDGEVVQVCKEHFSWSEAWKDPRVKLHVTDGANFVRTAKSGTYDVIIQDSSDPWTWGEDGEKVVLPSSVLYSEKHFQDMHRILANDGILVFQAECLQIPSDLNGARTWRQLALSTGFESARYGSIMVSSYPTGQIGLLMCEKNTSASSSLNDIISRYTQMCEEGKITSYYHPPLQSNAFVLPKWADKFIYDDIFDSTSCNGQKEL